MKKFEILYNPYNNQIHFRQANGKADSDEVEWNEIDSDSSFQKYQKKRCIFENCVEEILELINRFINTSGELEIDFIGTDADFGVLTCAVAKSIDPKSKGIVCECVERYLSSEEILGKIREAYQQIEDEFSDYMNNSEYEEDDDRVVIAKEISRFQETVDEEIPICVIGNYSVGKSALVNSLVGFEILPSHANSTTAKNVQVKNGDLFTLEFVCEGTEYILDINGNEILSSADGEKDEALLDELLCNTESLCTAEEILHQILENLNVETSEESFISRIEGTVIITVPFRKSELDTDRYSFVFIDTPGSNNGNEAQRIHRENLEKLMDEQTNALPIFVMSRNSLDSNDTNDLRTLLESKEVGFAVQNCIIAISMSDQLVEQQLAEEMPDKIKQWLSHPTIMYVSPVAAIGEKKIDKGSWIDGAYRQLYERKVSDLVDVIPPKYNQTPCGRTISNGRKKALPPLLYASGLPSLETEINYFAYRFAEYKKCTNGKEYLLNALILADQKLKEAKINLEDQKKAKVKEQNDTRDGLIKKINDVKLPAVNTVISSVNKEFINILNEYCNGVEALVRKTWESCKDKSDAMQMFEKMMAAHCQKNLYDAHIKDIKEKIETLFIEMTAQYIAEVHQCIVDGEEKLSLDAKKELEELFRISSDGPVLKDVSVGVFERIKLALLAKIPLKKTQELFIEGYTKKFIEKLKGSQKYYGVFASQCICQPAKLYSKQIVEWSDEYKKSIGETLNKDNAILSDLDDKIETMTSIIGDMENRLHNLSSVRTMLEGIIPGSLEVQEDEK